MYKSIHPIQDPVLTFDMSEADNLIAFGCEDSYIRIYSIEKFEEVKILPGHQGKVNNLKFSPCKFFFISTSIEGRIKLWSLEWLEEKAGLNIFPVRPEVFTYTNDGNFAYFGCSDAILRKWNIKCPEYCEMLKGHTGGINSICITTDDRYVITGSSDTMVKVWNTHTNDEEFTFNSNKSSVGCIRISLNNTYLASGLEDANVVVWDLKEKKIKTKLTGHFGEIYCLAFNSTSRLLASGSHDKSVKIWNIHKEICEFSYENDFGWTASVKFTSNDKYLLASASKYILIVDVFSKVLVLKLTGHESFITDLKLNKAETKIFSTCYKKKFIVWDISDFDELGTLTSNSPVISCIDLSEDGKFLASGSWDGMLTLWNMRELKIIFSQITHEKNICDLKFARNCKFFVTGSWDCKVKIWDLPSGELSTLIEFKHPIANIVISHDNFFILISTSENIINMWNTVTKQIDFKITHDGFITFLQITFDNKYIISTSADYTLKVTSLNQKSEVLLLTTLSTVVSSVILQDYSVLCCGLTNKEITIWDFTTKKQLKTLIGHKSSIKSLAISDFYKYLISSANDDFIIIWDLNTYVEVIRLYNDNHVASIELIENEALLVAGYRNGTVILWNFFERREEIRLNGHLKSTDFLKINRDQSVLVTGSVDNIIKVWDLKKYLQFVTVRKQNSIESLSMTTNIGNESFFYEELEISMSCPSIFYNGLAQRLRNQELPIESDCKIVLFPLNINLLHIYCYRNQSHLLQKALKLNCPIRKNRHQHSPLYYAFKKKSDKCIDIILEYITDLDDCQYKKYIEYSYALRDDILSIIKSPSFLVPNFINRTFRVCSQTKLPHTIERILPPILIISKIIRIYPEFFLKNSQKKTKKKASINFVEFKTTPIEFDLTNGSSNCLKLLLAIESAKNAKVFTCELIQVIVDYKWKQMKILIYFTSALLWTNLVLLVLLVSIFYRDFKLGISCFLLNLLMLCHEILQLRFVGIRVYFKNARNILDLTSILMTFVWGIFYFFEYEERVLASFMILVNFSKGISGFRAFNSTRYYIRLIMRAFIDTYSFVVIFIYTTFAFGALNLTLSEFTEDSFFFLLWKSPFELNLGSFSSNDSFNLSYFYFMVASIFNIVVMLNLLISILGDSFDKFQLEAVELDYKEKLGLVIEIESLFQWSKPKKKIGFIQYCEATKQEGADEVWNGKIKQIELEIKKSSSLLKSKVENLETGQKDLSQKCSNIEEKLENLIKLIKGQINS